MANYGKLTTESKIQRQGNPVSVTIANPTDEQRALLAQLRGELPIVETDPPAYDPETQWIEDFGRIVEDHIEQYWEVYDKPAPEPTIEERVNDLEDGMNAILGGEA